MTPVTPVTRACAQFPMNEIILKFDKMMPGKPKSEKREMLLKDSVRLLKHIGAGSGGRE